MRVFASSRTASHAAPSPLADAPMRPFAAGMRCIAASVSAAGKGQVPPVASVAVVWPQ